MNLAELLATGQATCRIEDVVRVGAGDACCLEIGRALAYELAANNELPFVLRCGRRYVVSVPALLQFLQVPLPPVWQVGGALAERCPGDESGSDLADIRTSGPTVGAL